MTSLAEYRPLRKRDFAFSKVAMFGLVGRKKVVLARKPMKRLFALPTAKPRFLDITFVTDANELAHGAVDVTIRYLGASVHPTKRTEHHQLFADPAHDAKPQRLWLVPPKGTRFAEISFSRAVRGLKVALDGRLRLRSGEGVPTLDDFDHVLASRDLTAMEHLLRLLEEEGGRRRAGELLARMRMLSRSRHVIRRQANLRDANHLLKYGPHYKVPGVKPLPVGCVSLQYTAARLTEDLEVMPLGKALVADALRLYREMVAAKTNLIEIETGEGLLAGLLMASILKESGAGLQVKVDWDSLGQAPLLLAPWLHFENGRSFLESPCGRVVHSMLTGA